MYMDGGEQPGLWASVGFRHGHLTSTLHPPQSPLCRLSRLFPGLTTIAVAVDYVPECSAAGSPCGRTSKK
jgi:hypothetical protein